MPSPLSISRIQEQLFSRKYLSWVMATTRCMSGERGEMIGEKGSDGNQRGYKKER
jgi:hypothetical protein